MKRWLRPLLLGAVPLAVIVVAVVLWLTGGRYVDTDDAYVKSDKVPVSVEVAGKVRALHVRENQSVATGAPLFTLETAPYEVALAKATAALARARTDVAALEASYREQEAQITLSRTREEFASREYRRQADLAAKGYVSAINLDNAREQVEINRQQTVALERDLARIRANLGGDVDLPVEQHPDYLTAAAAVAQAKLDLARTTVYAPYAGVVTQLPKVGRYLAPGTAALALVADAAPWVEANFTEKDLTNVRPGQPVELRFDIYPGRRWRGVVDSISPATGAEFSVLPPQNATGNWIKVTQRVPVRIELAPQGCAGAARGPLGLGENRYRPTAVTTAAHRTWVTIAVMAATVMQAIDTTIANVALPHMQGALSASFDQIAWVLTSYIVASAICIPLTGFLAARFGRKRVFTTAVIGFTLASMLCGAAQSLGNRRGAPAAGCLRRRARAVVEPVLLDTGRASARLGDGRWGVR